MKATILAFPICALAFGTACAPVSNQAKEDIAKPVNCRTAEGDIRVLNSEKAHAAEQLANGVMAVTPAGAALGIVSGTEGDKLKVATGEYDAQIDRKIAEIKRVCRL